MIAFVAHPAHWLVTLFFCVTLLWASLPLLITLMLSRAMR